MDRIILLLEAFFQNIPLSLLEIWGSFAFMVGIVLMVLAYGGFSLRTGDNWGIGRESQAWDDKALIATAISFVLIFITGYIGSFFVLVPGAQTFESLKDLSVFVCIVLFGYPALLAVPFAYGLTDLYEGVPPDFVVDWLMGYFINPACFWLAYQFIGKDPDFRKQKTWGRYLIFVILFMCIEPPLWGYICAGKFTPRISYNVITPALFFTTTITWILAPFAMMFALPLARKFRLYWAEIPSHVRQKTFGSPEWTWQSGPRKHWIPNKQLHQGIPLRLFLLIPFISVILITVGITAYYSIKNSENAATILGEKLQYEMSQHLTLQLNEFVKNGGREFDPAVVDGILNNAAAAKYGKVILANRNGTVVAESYHVRRGKVTDLALQQLNALKEGFIGINKPMKFRFSLIETKPLSREKWIMLASPYQKNFILVSILPESFFMAGVQKANSNSAVIFAFAMMVVLIVVALLGSLVVKPIQEVCHATVKLSEGDYSERIPPSKLKEIDTLANAFNHFASQLQDTIENLTQQNEEKNLSEYRLQMATDAANLGIWEWNIETNDLFWNDQMFEHYGLKKDFGKMKYDTWLENVAKDDHERVAKEVLAALVGEKDFNTEFKIKSRDTFKFIRAYSKTIRNEMGRPVRMIGVNLDVTERKIAENEIKRYRDHLEELVAIRTEALEKKSEQLKELTEKQAKSEIYEKFAHVFLSMRDNANSPLQVQRLVISILRKNYPEREDIIKHLEESVDSLTSMNKILTRLESKISRTDQKVMSEAEILEFLDQFELKS